MTRLVAIILLKVFNCPVKILFPLRADLVPIKFVIVTEKLGSLPIAVASSDKVSNKAGDELIRLAICVCT